MLAIMSNAPVFHVHRVLDALDLDDLPWRIVGLDTLYFEQKPTLSAYRMMLEQLRLGSDQLIFRRFQDERRGCSLDWNSNRLGAGIRAKTRPFPSRREPSFSPGREYNRHAIPSKLHTITKEPSRR